MTEFKQIIGRGTRLLTHENKWMFTIMDFRKATDKFSDPDFDDILKIYEINQINQFVEFSNLVQEDEENKKRKAFPC